jgi:metal-responsive CopG/Arc/MetJ family transcriptional regulator
MRTTLTISETLWAEVKKLAKREGISASEYVRRAIIMQIAWEARHRGDRAMARAAELGRRR